jgi:hypothetical protein
MVIFGAVPLVHAMLTVPSALRATFALACSDSYRPKLNAVVLIVQFAVTDADMPSTAVVPAARGGMESASAAAIADTPAYAAEDFPLRRSEGMPTPLREAAAATRRRDSSIPRIERGRPLIGPPAEVRGAVIRAHRL